MKQFIKPALLCAGFLPIIVNAQLVDRTKYPDYNPNINPDYSLLKRPVNSKVLAPQTLSDQKLPDHFNNADFKFFPPVFNQDGGSCGSASRICYMFTHEINAFRNEDAKLLRNRYPSHFVWLLTNGNSGKDEFIQFVGVPNAEVYGGTTYSALFGNQDTNQEQFGWMQGYDKWYSAMWNRMLSPGHFPISVQTEEGREAVKRWLYNHNGDLDFHGAGGLAGIGVASGGNWQDIPYSPTNKEIGVNGKKYVASWGKQVDHALTIVGYDDRIEFDLDGNGKVGEKEKDEVGAWIVVNSWGAGWCNKGFIYCPYKHAGPVGKAESGYWQPEIYKVRKNYRPLRTIKLKMDYSRRSELLLTAGVTDDLNATEPKYTINFEHFKYAGDGNGGRTNPAPEIPMLGLWADGKLHDEPMEFGYDLTDLSANFPAHTPLKYFFTIVPRSWAAGTGKIHNAAIMNYEQDAEGVEIPFNIEQGGMEIKNKGVKTVISTIVYSERYNAPTNVTLNGKELKWNAPAKSGHKVNSYKVYRDGFLLDEVNAQQYSYTLSEDVEPASYGIAAVYETEVESDKSTVSTPVKKADTNVANNFAHSGFSIPNIFNDKLQEATIEFWIKPNSLQDYNQSVGPGWGNFLFHTDANGALTVGWDTNDRRTSYPKRLKVGQWTHVAIVVQGSYLQVFCNGNLTINRFEAENHKGIGGFGDLVFNAGNNENSIDATIDEVRIWNIARARKEVQKEMNVEYEGKILPYGLISYFKGDTFENNGKTYLRDCLGGNHAEILNTNVSATQTPDLTFGTATSEMKLNILEPKETVYVGLPVTMKAVYSNAVTELSWTSAGAGVKDMKIVNPTLIFKSAGEQTVEVVGCNAQGEKISSQCTFNVQQPSAPDASFISTETVVAAGSRVTFIAKNPRAGYSYEWSTPDAETKHSGSVNFATSFPSKGKFTVTLTVTAPDGQQAVESKVITVNEIAPKAEFTVTPTTISKGETTFLKDASKYNPTKWQWMVQGGSKDVIINGQNSSYTPTAPGVYNITLTAINGTGSNSFTRERALVVCNADSKSGLNFTKPSAQVVLTESPINNKTLHATIEWWMNLSSLSPICCSIGEIGTFDLRSTLDGSATLFIGNSEKIVTPSGFITPAEWHHYALTINYKRINFYRDGVLFHSEEMQANRLPNVKEFSIGDLRSPILGQIDEFRIWNTTLNAEELQAFANEPIADIAKAEADHKLMVYYDFNQNGGNVEDRTSNKNTGIRKNFGPDGDAWGMSKGVFSLNFEKAAAAADVTKNYLKNYRKPFKKDANKSVNGGNKRFCSILDWNLENMQTSGDITTCVHVDNQKSNCFTFTSIWDDFGVMQDHKVYQTVTLPAGAYTFTAHYDDQYEGNCGNSSLVVSKGKTINGTLELNDAIAYAPMKSKSNTNMENSVKFVLAEETEVSIGMLVNLSYKACCTISRFELTHSDVEILEADGANGYDLAIDNGGFSTLYLPYPTIIPEGAMAFAVENVVDNKVTLKPIANVVPAKVGVIVAAKAGEYHFAPSMTGATAPVNSILTGVLKDTEVEGTARYYNLVTDGEPGFYLYNGTLLEANHAYLERDASDSNNAYLIDLTQVGIDEIQMGTTSKTIYDLSGRRVNSPAQGIYITNGKKVLVK